MNKVASILLGAVAVMGAMPTMAQPWNFNISIANSAETPVYLSLSSNGSAKATFTNGSTSTTLQPGQSTVVSATNKDPTFINSLAWNINYDFYDGINHIDQRVSSEGQANVSCASPSSSSVFHVSQGTYVGESFTTYDVGVQMASEMGLSGVGSFFVGNVIDTLLTNQGFDPTQGSTNNYNYWITIGQRDYNMDRLAGVQWGAAGATPPVTFIQKQQVYQYTESAWLTFQPEYLSNKAMIAEFWDKGRYASIGTETGQIICYDITGGVVQPLSNIAMNSGNTVVQLSSNPNSASFQYVAAFSDYSVWYYDGTNVHQLHSTGWSSTILQMNVEWSPTIGLPPNVVVGLADGAVEYYNGVKWTELHDEGWQSSVMHLSVYWSGDTTGSPQVVVGLGNGAIEYWNGTTWTELHDGGWQSPVYQLDTFNWELDPGGGAPFVNVALFDGSINQYSNQTQTWTNLMPELLSSGYCTIDWWPEGNFVFLAGFSDGSVQLCVGDEGPVKWIPLQPATGNRVQFLSANWDNFDPKNPVLPYVYSSNYKFTYANWSNVIFSYPAIPSPASTNGHINGDRKNDPASVVRSKRRMLH